jgi:hypothetical protein
MYCLDMVMRSSIIKASIWLGRIYMGGGETSTRDVIVVNLANKLAIKGYRVLRVTVLLIMYIVLVRVNISALWSAAIINYITKSSVLNMFDL